MDTTLLPATIRWSSSRIVDQRQRLLQVPGEGLVGGAGLGQARGVVVRDDHGGGMVAQRFAHDFARIDRGLRQGAAREFTAGDQAQLAVQVEADAMLDPPVAQRGLAVLLDAPGWSRAVSRVRSSSMARRASSRTAASMQALAAPRPGTASSSSGVAPIARAGRKTVEQLVAQVQHIQARQARAQGDGQQFGIAQGGSPVTQQPFPGRPCSGRRTDKFIRGSKIRVWSMFLYGGRS